MAAKLNIYWSEECSLVKRDISDGHKNDWGPRQTAEGLRIPAPQKNELMDKLRAIAQTLYT